MREEGEGREEMVGGERRGAVSIGRIGERGSGISPAS
jgi:hypothetical protein